MQARDIVRRLLRLLKPIPAHVLFVFTTTNDGQDALFEDALFEDAIGAGPLLSRCVRLELARRGLSEPFAERVREIAQAEALDGRYLADPVLVPFAMSGGGTYRTVAPSEHTRTNAEVVGNGSRSPFGRRSRGGPI